MNFIFDVGNVLVSYKPKSFLEGLFPDEGLASKVFEIIFKCAEWESMDLGKLTHKEATAIFCAREPEYKAAIEKTMDNLFDIFTPEFATISLLPEIKKAGHDLYYLSNIHREVRDYILAEYRVFDLFDGGVFSCDVFTTKPSAEIYLRLLSNYRLSPEDCLFFDDVEENVEAARKQGISGILFTGVECVLPYYSGK